MNFTVEKSIEILERTPKVLEAMVRNISPEWTENNEGGETWSVFDVLGHLVHGEKTDWMPRVEIILSDTQDKAFKAFDRFAQFEEGKGKTLRELLDEFKSLRKKNIGVLRSKKLTDKTFEEKGVHPAFGEVTLAQLIATWTVHDLDHIAQISRVMAKQYKEEVGPWIKYLRILNLKT
ncbi:MAG: DinB family protein [Acidobacteria bacterium]|nr:DinB family protein [Acidobacteriota bacterium]MCA1637331.1 DinB family protein [Acidobacteriota bacterium]